MDHERLAKYAQNVIPIVGELSRRDQRIAELAQLPEEEQITANSRHVVACESLMRDLMTTESYHIGGIDMFRKQFSPVMRMQDRSEGRVVKTPDEQGYEKYRLFLRLPEKPYIGGVDKYYGEGYLLPNYYQRPKDDEDDVEALLATQNFNSLACVIRYDGRSYSGPEQLFEAEESLEHLQIIFTQLEKRREYISADNAKKVDRSLNKAKGAIRQEELTALNRQERHELFEAEFAVLKDIIEKLFTTEGDSFGSLVENDAFGGAAQKERTLMLPSGRELTVSHIVLEESSLWQERIQVGEFPAGTFTIWGEYLSHTEWRDIMDHKNAPVGASDVMDLEDMLHCMSDVAKQMGVKVEVAETLGIVTSSKS